MERLYRHARRAGAPNERLMALLARDPAGNMIGARPADGRSRA